MVLPSERSLGCQDVSAPPCYIMCTFNVWRSSPIWVSMQHILVEELSPHLQYVCWHFINYFLCVNYIFALDCYDYAELVRNWWNACWILPFLHLTVVQWLLTVSILLVPISALIVDGNQAGPLIQTKFFPRLNYLTCGLFYSMCIVVGFYQFQIYLLPPSSG